MWRFIYTLTHVTQFFKNTCNETILSSFFVAFWWQNLQELNSHDQNIWSKLMWTAAKLNKVKICIDYSGYIIYLYTF